MGDDDILSMRNWGYYEQPSVREHIGLQLMPSLAEEETKSFLNGHGNPILVSANGVFNPRDCAITEPSVAHLDYVRDTWINHRDKFLNMFPENLYNTILAEPSVSHNSFQTLSQPDVTKETEVSIEELSGKKDSSGARKRSAAVTPKPPRAKKSRKGPSARRENDNSSVHYARKAKKNMDFVINGADMDISGIPIPVCSCTGAPQQCYRWGCGGWQSACCTTTISMYPLPTSTKRRGARIAGRKMSQGAFKKVLEKLSGEGYNFNNPIDLKTYWAKHGTNKFVTIR